MTQKKTSKWGVGIFVFYGAFVVFTLALVMFVSLQEIQLTEPDYYQKELTYQDRIDQLNNTAGLTDRLIVRFDRTAGALQVRFPREAAPESGEVHLFRPSNADLDSRFEVTADTSGLQSFPVGSLPKGLWRVRVDWRDAAKAYYHEQILIVE